MKGNWGKTAGAMASMILAVLFRFVSPLIIAYALDTVLGNEPSGLPVFINNIVENAEAPR